MCVRTQPVPPTSVPVPGTCISHGESLTFFKKRLKQTRLHVPVICTQYQRYLYCNVMYMLYVCTSSTVCVHVYMSCVCQTQGVHVPPGYPH